MASWKKVLVSGSAGEFSTITASIGLTVGTNQTISTTQAILTGSFTGSFRGDGSGLTGVVANFPSSATSNLINTDRIFVNTGSSGYITYGDLLTDLAGTNLATEGGATPDSLTLASDISGINSIAVSSTITANGSPIGFIGNITGSNVKGTVESASYALSSSYSTTASYALNAGGGTLNISGSDGNVASIALGTQALIVSGTANEVKVTVNNTNKSVQLGLPTNVTIQGTLTVNGTVTTVSSSNLLVSDKFILLSSGSTSKNDGGIIIQSARTGTTGSGYGLFLDGTPAAPRWGVTSSLSQYAQNAETPDEWMVTAKTVGTVQTAGSTAPTYGGATASGNGNMIIDSNGDIWIYVF